MFGFSSDLKLSENIWKWVEDRIAPGSDGITKEMFTKEIVACAEKCIRQNKFISKLLMSAMDYLRPQLQEHAELLAEIDRHLQT